jgi:hypothetical protein
MQVIVQTGHIHTRAVILVGRIHTHDALPTGRVPIDKLISVEDCFIISVGVEGVS